MAVRIRLKRLGRRHRPFFRVCAMDARAPRDGKVIEELGYYDPMVPETDARAILNGERIGYWLSVGAQPTEKVQVLIRKYGSDGTHLEAQRAAIERLAVRRKTVHPQPVASMAAAAEGGMAGGQTEATADEMEAVEQPAEATENEQHET